MLEFTSRSYFNFWRFINTSLIISSPDISITRIGFIYGEATREGCLSVWCCLPFPMDISGIEFYEALSIVMVCPRAQYLTSLKSSTFVLITNCTSDITFFICCNIGFHWLNNWYREDKIYNETCIYKNMLTHWLIAMSILMRHHERGW